MHSWHNDAIADHLEAISRGEIRFLQINQPPGTMKSLTASVLWPAWEWTQWDWLRYLTTSYKEGYAVRDSRRHRDIVVSDWYREHWPHVRLIRDPENNFENTRRGSRLAVAMNALTAGRGNRVIIDDPHSTEQAESEADRDKTTRIFRESAQSRVNDPERDSILVIMHRLHPQDVCGVIEELGLPYVKLVLPMEYVRSLTVKTPYFSDPRKEEGELLCPARLGQKEVDRLKIATTEHAWDTQYNQQARARAGAYFFSREDILIEQPLQANQVEASFEPCDYPPRCDTVFGVVDTASKTGKNRDGTGVAWYAYSQYPTPHAVVLDWELFQTEARLLTTWMPNWIKRTEELALQCGAVMGSTGVWVEDKDSGVVLIQHSLNNGWPVTPIDSKLTAAGKEGRAISVSGYVDKGMMKVSRCAYDKIVVYKGRAANHYMKQVTGYRIGVGTENDEDELFDAFCYGCAISFGNIEGY